MDEKLKLIANQIMELCQAQRLTNKEMWDLITSIEGKVSSQRYRTMNELPFIASHF